MPPNFWGDPMFWTTCLRPQTAAKICMVIKLNERKIFTWSTTPPALAKKIFDMKAIANIVDICSFVSVICGGKSGISECASAEDKRIVESIATPQL